MYGIYLLIPCTSRDPSPNLQFPLRQHVLRVLRGVTRYEVDDVDVWRNEVRSKCLNTEGPSRVYSILRVFELKAMREDRINGEEFAV